MSSDSKQKKYFAGAPHLKNPHKPLENHYLYYGVGMQAKCMDFQTTFINHVGTMFGTDVSESIIKQTGNFNKETKKDIKRRKKGNGCIG